MDKSRINAWVVLCDHCFTQFQDCVEQGHYGHRARKATWLYACRCVLPSLKWGKSAAGVRDEGFHSFAERLASRSLGKSAMGRLSKPERSATPPAFRDVLLDMARSVRRDAA